VAVLGYEFWRSRFGGASDIGKQIRIEGHPFMIIGVTRKWFSGMTTGEPPDITIPITAYPPLMEGNEFTLDSRSILWLSVIGRLKDGVTIDQARAQLQSFWPDVLLATASTETAGARRQRFLSMVSRSQRPQEASPVACVPNLHGRSAFSPASSD
jgi:hypothetical protein